MKRNLIFFVVLTMAAIMASCSDDDEKGVTMQTFMWQHDSCTVRLPVAFGADAVVKSDGAACDVVLNGDKMTILTGENLGCGKIIVDEPGKNRIVVELEIGLPQR